MPPWPSPTWPSSGAWPRPRLRPVVAAGPHRVHGVFAGALAWLGLTTGVGVAAAAGAGVAHPAPGVTDAIYLGVRLGPAELVDPVVRQDLVALDASAVVDENTAMSAPGAVRALLNKGIDVESGGTAAGPAALGRPGAPWSQALSDSRSAQVLSQLVHQPVDALCPDRSISAFDLVDASSAHLMMVVPNVTLPLAPSGPFPRQELGVPLMQSGPHLCRERPRCSPRPSSPPCSATCVPSWPANNWAASRSAGSSEARRGCRHRRRRVDGARGLAQVLPAASGVRRGRIRWAPSLAGVGAPGHVALTFDDGPDPGIDAGVPRRPRRAGLAGDVFHARAHGRRSPRSGRRGRPAGP